MSTCNTAFVSPRGWYSGMSPSKPCDICIMSTCHIFMSHIYATIVMMIIKYYRHYANFTIFNFLTGRGAGNDELNWSFPAMLMVPGNCRGSGVTAKLTTVAGSLFPQFCHWKASTRDAFVLPYIECQQFNLFLFMHFMQYFLINIEDMICSALHVLWLG